MLDSTQLAIGGGMVGVPIDTACTLTAAGAARCWGYLASGSGTGSSSPGYSPVTSVANGITGIKSISPGTNTTCYVRASDESVWCWGDNTVGGVGQGSGAASFYATPQQVLFP